MQHIDDALWGMRKRSQKYHDLFDQNVAILDELFSQWLCGHWEKFNLGKNYKDFVFDDVFIKYVNGEKPLRGKAWENVHTLYAPLNIEGKHWVSLAVKLEKWEIVVFDSNINLTPERKFIKHLEPFRCMLPYLLRQSGKFMGRLHKIPEPFTCRRLCDIPQDQSSGDCGIFAIKHIEFDMCGLNMNYVHDDNIVFFRKKMSCEIYNRDWDP
ncbi:uncharacterized protein LOC133806723 [Humulus lupulus]|uniref:uncharacterized protein LOC133806723 n=1 Tax=Humulus lupulus TaxID=3486 RepID=UPI002B40F7D4|nr:uncharacterized protein LOC133806723 [Humulus lupulus]